jgi:uncharacterized secreted protein with C-terminal beta-propeller domain
VWQFFDKEKSEDFKPISYITNSDGIWVKSDKDQVISVADEVAKLHNFDDLKEVKSYIKDMVLLGNGRWRGGYYPLMMRGTLEDGVVYAQGAPNSVSSSSSQKSVAPEASNSSKTNLQEEGVDEADIIKHNDTHIFYLKTDPKDYNTKIINVTTFENIASNNLKPINSVKTAGDTTNMYLVGDQLVVLSRNGTNYKIDIPDTKEKKILSGGGDISSMIVEIFNISDMKRVEMFKINGSINDSRVIDGKLYLVTSFRPYVNYTYPKIYVKAPECKDYFHPYYDDTPKEEVSSGGGTTVSSESNEIEKNATSKSIVKITRTDRKDFSKCYDLVTDGDGKYFRYDYENPKVTYERLIPSYTVGDEKEKTLIEPKKFFASDKKDQDAVITTLSKIDIASAKLEDTSSFLGNANTVYASQKALYVVSYSYPWYFGFNRTTRRSALYKFDLGEEMGYKSFGFVKGNLLNQFSLSEYNDVLRVATTEGNSWQNNTKNSIFTLKSVDENLLIQGALSGLGKEGETIHAVRFLGDKGFVVTFKRTDPFYTLDLSDASNPKKVGELSIDGYSSYLHPVGEDLILGFGRDATPDGQVAGLKLELFDVSDLANPQVKDTYTFTNDYSYSEIEHSHKALAFRDSDNLFAFAYNQYQKNSRSMLDKLGVFQVEGDKISVYKPIVANSNAQQGMFKRALIFDIGGESYVAYFSNGVITYKQVSSLVKEIR